MQTRHQMHFWLQKKKNPKLLFEIYLLEKSNSLKPIVRPSVRPAKFLAPQEGPNFLEYLYSDIYK